MRFACSVLFAIAFAAIALPALAQGVIVERSEIAFTATQLGVGVDGRFRRWKADIAFDPANVANARAVVDVDLASVDLASDDSDAEVSGPLWFNAARFPVAHFASKSVRALGGDRFEVAGELSLKGLTRPVVVPLSVRRDASGNLLAEGRFSLKRLDYRIGDGEWADPQTVADDVAVRVRMVLAPARK